MTTQQFGSLPRIVFFLCAALPSVGCGNPIDCDYDYTFNDPSGRWSGTLVRVESDCGSASKGAQFNFEHDISLECSSATDTDIYLYNEENLEFKETSSSIFGGGSFTVQNERSGVTTDITYDGFDGRLADVTQKIRVYSDGKIVCSELFKGEARR